MLCLYVFCKACPTLSRMIGWALVVVMLLGLVCVLTSCSANGRSPDDRLKKAQAAYMLGQAANTTKGLHSLRFDNRATVAKTGPTEDKF